MWILGLVLIGAVLLAESKTTPAPAARTTLTQVASTWPTQIVLNLSQMMLMGYGKNADGSPTMPGAQFAAVTTGAYQFYLQANPAVSSAAVGVLPVWLSDQLLNQKNRVFMGKPIQGPSGGVVPFALGSPPATGGYVEVVAS